MPLAIRRLQALSALAFFAAKDELNTGVFALAKRCVKLGCQATLLRSPLFFQLREGGIHLCDLCIQLRQRVLRFA